MRTSHVAIRRRMAEIRANATDKVFFTSQSYKGYLADLAEATGNRYKKPIRVLTDWDESEDADAAYTDNKIIYINTTNRVTASFPNVYLKSASIIGLLAHEVGHVLFSDFELLARYQKAFELAEFFPAIPTPVTEREEIALNEILEAIKKNKKGRKIAIAVIRQITASVQNIIEDVYVNARMCFAFPGKYKTGIMLNNERIFDQGLSLKEQMDKVTADGEKLQPIVIMINLLLQYALSGDIHNPDELENGYTEALIRSMPYIDEAVYDECSSVRFDAANKVLLNIWPFVKEMISDAKNSEDAEKALEKFTKQFEEQLGQNGGTNIPTGSNSSSVQGNPSGASPQKGSTQKSGASNNTGSEPKKPTKAELSSIRLRPGEGSVSKNAGKPGKETAAKEVVNAAANAQKDNNAGNQESANETGQTETGKENTANSTTFENIQLPGLEGPEESLEYQEVSQEETGRLPLTETEGFETGDSGGVEQNNDYTGNGYESCANDVERLLDKMAESVAVGEAEANLANELQRFNDGIRYGNAHSGVRVSINRMKYVDSFYKEQYQQIAQPLLLLSKRMQKQVSQILKDKRDGGKLTNLLFGRRFNARTTVQNDGRYFYNNKLPQNPMELAVAVLVDESGSMSSKDRATSARAASIVLYDFCRGLDIPVGIYGHTSDGVDVQLYAHADFDSVDNNDKYRLMDISSRRWNRDGAALRYTAERLLERPETVKLLILISDGQPSSGDYRGTAAEEDLRGIKKEYERKGIKLFAAAIGDDKPNIERIYKDGFLDITDLNKLPQNLCGLLNRYIRTLGA